jgi:hypothetical protein
MADLPFPVRIRKQLVAEGRASLHHVHPESGWVSVHIHHDGDVDNVINLFRLNLERPWLAAGIAEPRASHDVRGSRR